MDILSSYTEVSDAVLAGKRVLVVASTAKRAQMKFDSFMKLNPDSRLVWKPARLRVECGEGHIVFAGGEGLRVLSGLEFEYIHAADELAPNVVSELQATLSVR